MKKKCVECGREFEARDNRNIVCSDKCRRNRVNARLREERAMDKVERKGSGAKRSFPKLSIDEVLRVARKHGLRYGEAVPLIETGVIK